MSGDGGDSLYGVAPHGGADGDLGAVSVLQEDEGSARLPTQRRQPVGQLLRADFRAEGQLWINNIAAVTRTKVNW